MRLGASARPVSAVDSHTDPQLAGAGPVDDRRRQDRALALMPLVLAAQQAWIWLEFAQEQLVLLTDYLARWKGRAGPCQ